MKTLVLATVSAAALMMAGAAAAQSTAGVEAVFNSGKAGLSTLNGADSSRPGQPYDTRSYVDQVGNGNSASVDQSIGYTEGGSTPAHTDNNYGQPLTSVVLQGWGGGYSDNSAATVTQSGLGNTSVIMQRNYPTDRYGANSASVSQSGTNDNAFSYQFGNQNSASISQSGTDSGKSSSSVTDSSTANSGGTFVTSFHGADQSTSHLNDAGGRVIQDEAINDHGTLNQTGNNDKGTIVQWYAERSTANVTQGGTNNAALSYNTQHDSSTSIYQSAGSMMNKATVYQVSADQDGSDYGSVGADDSGSNNAIVNQSGNMGTATLLQAGYGNNANITQSTGYNPVGMAYANDAAIRQVGTYLTANTNQSGADDHSLTLQTGSSNTANVGQSNAAAYSLVQQSGSGQSATVNQATGGPTNSFFTVSKVDQTGVNNTANVYQTGRDAFSDVAQTGLGDRNYATINQTSFNAVSYAYQNGGGNQISVNQH